MAATELPAAGCQLRRLRQHPRQLRQHAQELLQAARTALADAAQASDVLTVEAALAPYQGGHALASLLPQEVTAALTRRAELLAVAAREIDELARHCNDPAVAAAAPPFPFGAVLHRRGARRHARSKRRRRRHGGRRCRRPPRRPRQQRKLFTHTLLPTYTAPLKSRATHKT